MDFDSSDEELSGEPDSRSLGPEPVVFYCGESPDGPSHAPVGKSISLTGSGGQDKRKLFRELGRTSLSFNTSSSSLVSHLYDDLNGRTTWNEDLDNSRNSYSSTSSNIGHSYSSTTLDSHNQSFADQGFLDSAKSYDADQGFIDSAKSYDVDQGFLESAKSYETAYSESPNRGRAQTVVQKSALTRSSSSSPIAKHDPSRLHRHLTSSAIPISPLTSESTGNITSSCETQNQGSFKDRKTSSSNSVFTRSSPKPIPPRFLKFGRTNTREFLFASPTRSESLQDLFNRPTSKKNLLTDILGWGRNRLVFLDLLKRTCLPIFLDGMETG